MSQRRGWNNQRHRQFFPPPPILLLPSSPSLLGPSWAPWKKLNAAAPRQTHGELVEQGKEEEEEEEEEEGGVVAWDIFGSLGPLEGLRAPRHQGKPRANWSNAGPSWALFATSAFLGRLGALLGRLRAELGVWAPEGASCAPAPRQTHGKLVGTMRHLGTVSGLLGPIEQLQAPQHHGKPTANLSNKRRRRKDK